MPLVWGGCDSLPSGNFGSFRRDGRMGLKGKTEQKIHFTSSFAITYPNNVLTINALRDAGLQRQGKHAYTVAHYSLSALHFSRCFRS